MDFFDDYDVLRDIFDDWTAGGQDLPTLSDIVTDRALPTLLNQDYNLNSPLIADDASFAISYLQHGTIDPRFNHKVQELKEIRRVLDDVGYDIRNLVPTWLQHQKIPDIIYSSESPVVRTQITKRWKAIWNYTKDPVNTTEKILGSSPEPTRDYNKRFSLINSVIPEFVKIHKELLSFYETHFIIYMMNSTQQCTRQSWQNDVLFTVELPSLVNLPNITILGKSNRDIKWVVGKSYALHVPTHTLLDKNFILMIKDISLARAMSQLSMAYRQDRPPNDHPGLILREIYDKGDLILSKFGNDAYDVLKLLEAACTEKWNELGHQYRPFIPLSTSLREHLDKTRRDSPLQGQEIDNFFNVIEVQDDPWIVGQIYGAFRHWGHPFINYLEGLKQLEERVNENLEIDENYANCLASDMTYLVLQQQFRQQKRWFATTEGLPEDSSLRSCILEGVWPTAKVIEDFGDHWHELDLLPCFNIPDTVDMADLFSDKAHSMQRSKVIQHIQTNPHNPIPGLRVMDTLLNSDNLNVASFLTQVNNEGLLSEDLVIGLKAKERELKITGRFFALMSWRMRLYFVLTELLLKKHFVPLFSGLTVADDLNTMLKKLLSATEYQGTESYEKVGIANSLDYSKWNNLQRKTSNSPVFTVLGKFLGLPNIFTYTHDIFESSLIYYNDRPDLMTVFENKVTNTDQSTPVSWEGQLGGLEGLRQKGWSILNYLVLRREALTRNTHTKFLAQGDNQIVITEYVITSSNSQEALRRELHNIWQNNSAIMERIRLATGCLGLRINQDEVVTSAELLIYGKIPIFRGKILPLESKRWARMNCVTNDQIPTLANSMSSCVTGALTVCQFSEDAVEVMHQYHFFASFVAAVCSVVNPVVGLDPLKFQTTKAGNKKLFFLRLLYKDPSVGGVCGTNLARFILSRFPDPVTESLSWWKLLYLNSNDEHTKLIALECGNPRLGIPSTENKIKLLENPTSLNIPGGLSSDTIIKEKVLDGLKGRISNNTLNNQLIKEAVNYTEQHKQKFVFWLFSIRPVFPRFLSEFYSSTFFRVTESIVSVFQNSRTIRKTFSREFSTEVLQVIVQSEQVSIKSMTTNISGSFPESIWPCSATRADELRKVSWGTLVTGVTVPHPLEILKENYCNQQCSGHHVIVRKVPIAYRDQWTKGPLTPYLGSKTKESTSLVQPWEKSLEIPLIKRACEMRKAINWFVDAESNLGNAIYDNIHSLTGVDLKEELTAFRRTGSSKHRLHCSRVSNEGNPAVGFNRLCYVTVTTDGLSNLNEDNHDFMYQSLICWASVLSTLPTSMHHDKETTHFHIRDPLCLRLIEEEVIEAPAQYKFLDKSESVKRMLTSEIQMVTTERLSDPPAAYWSTMTDNDRSWELGRAQGFLWGLSVFANTTRESRAILFPTSITRKVAPFHYMDGLHRGLMLGATLTPMYTRYGSLSEKARLKFEGSYWNILDKAIAISNLPNLINHERFTVLLNRIGSDIVKKYPASPEELSDVLRRYFLRRLLADRKNRSIWTPIPIVCFADMNSEFIIGVFRVAESVLPAFQHNRVSDRHMKLLNNSNQQLRWLSDLHHGNLPPEDALRLRNWLKSGYLPKYSVVPSEARHAVQILNVASETDLTSLNERVPYEEAPGLGSLRVRVEYQPQGLVDYTQSQIHNTTVPQKRCPLFSAVRVVQLSTGAHYKYKDLSEDFSLQGDAIFCGDGSGGMGANYLREHPRAKVIFNSKLDLSGSGYQGLIPSGPGAYLMSGNQVKERCVNFSTSWEEPSDLRSTATFEHFLCLIDKHQMKIGVFCCDAQITDYDSTTLIENNLLQYLPQILKSKRCHLIYKTYWNWLIRKTSLANHLGFYFRTVYFCLPSSQSSFTSEVYLVATDLKDQIDPIQTEITPIALLALYDILRVNKSDEDEFMRASSFKYELSTQGFFTRIPYQNLEEIAILLASAGLETGLSISLAETVLRLINSKIHPLPISYGIMYLLSRKLLPVTAWTSSIRKLPPSTQLQKLLGLFYGFWYGVALLMSDKSSFKKINLMYQGDSTISLGATKPYFNKKVKRMVQFLTWRLGPGENSKTIDPGPRSGLTQQIIRLLWVLYKGEQVDRSVDTKDMDLVNKMLMQYDKQISLKIIGKRTGIFVTTMGDQNECELNQVLPDDHD